MTIFFLPHWKLRSSEHYPVAAEAVWSREQDLHSSPVLLCASFPGESLGHPWSGVCSAASQSVWSNPLIGSWCMEMKLIPPGSLQLD